MGKEPDIIAIKEIKPKNSRYTLSYADYKIDGYEAFPCNLHSSNGRGLLIYEKNELNAVTLNLNTDFMEHSLIQNRTANNELLTIGCVYRSRNSPDTNNENMNNLIYKFDELKSANKLLIRDCVKICWENGTTITQLEAAFVNCLRQWGWNINITVRSTL